MPTHKGLFRGMLFTGLLLGSPFLFASMQGELVRTADRAALERMASLRGIRTAGVETEDLRARLAEVTGAGTTDETEESAPRWRMRIDHAENLRKAPDGSAVSLLGEVAAEVLLPGSEEGQGRSLQADKVVVDADHSLLAGMGDVTYGDADPGAAVQSMHGDIITLDWDRSLLTITGGSTRTERENSEGQSWSFVTSGDLITYDTKSGRILFSNGSITTNPVHAYSSISADRIAIMDNGDMFLRGARLSIGRVPLLWVPYFMFPGSRMLGNPAIGFESQRGWFVNTSFEIYGSYPAATESGSSSSFTRLLETDTDGPMVLDGPVYRPRTEADRGGRLDTWARDSGSYLVLLGDAYQYGGVSLGAVTENYLWGKALSIKADGRLAAIDADQNPRSFVYYPDTRYLLESEIKLDTQVLDLDLVLPLYSDPRVKRTYTNRFTRFSLDHLWGAEWPETYTGEVTDFTWKASGSFSLPSSWRVPLLDTLRVSTAEASARYKWQRKDGEYAYRLYAVTVPDLSATAGGTLFSWNEQPRSFEERKTEEPAHRSDDPLVDRMLQSAYRADSVPTASSSSGRSAALTWRVDERMNQTGATVGDEFDWEGTRYLSSSTDGSLDFRATVDPRWLTLDQSLSPQYRLVYDASKTTREQRQFTLASTSKASVPLLGLSYTLSRKLYTYTEKTTVDAVTDEEERDEESHTGRFTRTYVTTHQVSVSKTLSLAAGSLTPGMTWVLPPLTQSLVPSLAYRIGPWNFTGSFKFLQQEEDGPLERDLISAGVAFSSTLLTWNLNASYQQQKFRHDDPWYPFASDGAALLRWGPASVSGSFSFQNDKTGYEGEHYFNSLSYGCTLGPVQSTWTWRGVWDDLEKYTWTARLDLAGFRLRFWKRRITLSADVDASMVLNWQNHYASNIRFSATFGCSVAEFLDLRFSIESANTGLFSYYEGEVFRWEEMGRDLARSFDLFGGGIHRTNFNMSNLSLELVHHMEDWTLNCKYTGSVVLSDNKYSWVPVVSVFLQWKTIPELKVDENWTKKSSSGAWEEASSVYGDD